MGNNIPKLTRRKNIKRSAAKMASKIIYTTMPALNETVSSSKQAFMDIKQFTVKGRSRLNVQNKYTKNNLLRPINEIIQNAKDDLKSGKIYNEERMMEAQSSSMSDFLGDMSGEDSYQESNDDSMSSFNKFIASTSANSMNSARAISDTQIKTTEYLGELSISQHTQNLIMSRQQHLDQLNKLDNLEKIGLSLAEFNTKTMNEHIKATHQFYNEILAETQELRKSIDSMAKNINSRFGTGNKKKIARDAIGNVFGGGSFNLSGYFDEVKKNIGNQVPFSMDMIKGIFNDFKASPISGLMSLASGFMIPNGLKKGAGKLDKSIQGLFAQYLGTMDQWKHGKGLSNNDFLAGLQKLAGSIGAVDLTAKVNPDLSSYKNEAITLELEQKKAKAITEVIPSYLSQILNAVSRGKTNMYYNYDSGKFEDIKAAKEKSDTDFRKSIIYAADDTTKFFKIHANKLEFPSKEHKKAFEEDTETFLIYMYSNPTSDVNYIASGAFYNDMLRKGMSFRLGEFSVKMLKARWLSATPAERRDMTTEMMGNISLVKDISNRRDIDLQSSGKSALYNDLYTYGSNKKPLKIDKDFQKQLLIQSTIPMSIDEADIAYYREQAEKDLGREKKEKIFKDRDNSVESSFYGTKVGRFYKKAKDKYNSISNELESRITKITDTIAEKTESVLNGDLVDFDTEPVEFKDSPKSSVRVKARKVARNTINKNRIRKMPRKIYAATQTSSPTTQAIMSSAIDYRPYFDTIDSHLRNIATIISQDKALHVSSDPSNGSMTGMMSGASDKLKGIYSSGKESAKNIFNSLKGTFSSAKPTIKSFAGSVGGKVSGLKEKAGEIVDKVKDSDLKGKFVDGVEVVKDKTGKIVSNIKESGIKNKISSAISKTKESGLSILSKIASGISTAGGNVVEYFKSDSFKELLGGLKTKISGVLSKGKEFAGTLFDKIKSGGGNLLKKGKGMAIGGTISSMLGLGPIPGAIIGTLFTKNKKKSTSSEDDKQLDQMEKQDSKGEGFLDKFKGKKKKSVLLGAGISSMLGLGPMPGALLTMIYNKKFVKKQGEEKDEEKQAQDIAEGVENAEKQSKGISKGKKMKNLTIGAMASSMLGLGPMPGVIAASIYNKHKDKVAKKKNKEEQKQAEGATEAMEEATGGKKKGGILSKIKNFFGKGKNLALGATASTLLGLGPLPGIVVASMYNKKKYKKKNDENETLNNTVENAKDKALSKTVESPEAKEQRKRNKEYIEHVKQARDAEASGNTDKAERMEEQLLNKAKSSGDVTGAEQAQSLVSNQKNATNGSVSGKKEIGNPKKEGLFSKLGNLLSGGGIGGLLTSLIPVLGGGLLAYIMNKLGKDDEWSETDYGISKVGTGLLGTNAVKDMILTGGKKGGGAYTAGQIFSGVNELKRGNEELNNGDNLVDKTTGSAHIVRGTTNIGSAGLKILGGASKGYIKAGGLSNSIKKTAFKNMSKTGDLTTRLAAYKTAKTSATTALTKGKTGITGKIVGWITKMIKGIGTKVGKTKGGAILAKQAAKIGSSVVGKFAKNLAAKAATFLAKYGQPIGWAITIAQAVWDFISGWNDVRNIMETDSSYDPPVSLKITAGLSKALSNFLLGLIPVKWLTSLIFGLIANDADKEELAKAQEKSKSEYEAFLEENPEAKEKGLTFDKYQQITNVTTWGKVKNFFGGIFGKKAPSLSDYTNKNQININYDASENTTVAVSDTSGSGGRGPSLSKQSTSNIIKYARDKLSKNIYSTGSQKLSDEDIDKYVNSPAYSNKKKGFFSSLGETITNAAKWAGGKLSTAWDWFKGLFTGSGGRGTTPSTTNTTTNNYTYYSQKDPKWANQAFGKYNGKRDTVKAGGCGPTVAAMALEQLTGKQVLPSTMADLALKAGYKYDNGGTDPSFFNTAGSLYGVNFNQTPGFNKATVESLKAGVPVPLLGKSGPYGPGSHYVLATGMDNSGNVSILDPQNKSNNKKYPVKSFLNTTRSSMVAENSLVKTARGKSKNNKYVKYLKRFSGRGDELSDAQKKIINEATSRVGETTFRSGDTAYAGQSVGGMCLAFSQNVYDAALGIKVTRSSSPHAIFSAGEKSGKYSTDMKSMPVGAAVLYKLANHKYGHTGIYVGNNKVIHAAKNGVIEGDLELSTYLGSYEQIAWTTFGQDIGTAIDTQDYVPTITPSTPGNNTTSSTQGQTVIQSLLNSLTINPNSTYAKITSSSLINENSPLSKFTGSLLKTVGGTTVAAAGVDQGPTSYSKNFGTTSRVGTIYLPDNLGKASTWMGWQKITATSSDQYKLREDAGMNFDENGLAIIDGRYVVAVTPKFGKVGDYITVTMADGSKYKCIIGDIKGGDAGNEWGHSNGSSVVEAIANQDLWGSREHSYNHQQIPWRRDTNDAAVASITNEGNYWGRGKSSSILPYKVKSNIASMKPNIPDRMIYGRSGTISASGALSVSKNVLNNKNNIKLNKSLLESARGVIDIPNKSISSSSGSSKVNRINNKDDMLLSALENIVLLLTDIRSSNKTISEKNFSPVVGVNSGSNSGGYIPNNQKSALIDNIIAGI